MTDQRDRGSTLVELVVATLLLGIVLSGLVVSARTVFTADAPVRARLDATHEQSIANLQSQTSTSAPATTTPISDGPITITYLAPHRCRGGITVLIDTSTSVYTQSAATAMVSALRTFVQSLEGAPLRVRLVTFNLSAAVLAPSSTSGAQVSTLVTSSALSSMYASIDTLDDSSTTWRAGSNWEDALWQAVRRDVGTILTALPDLIVLITDDVPTRNRTNTSTDGDNTFHETDVSRAVTAATYARSTGATLAGILVGAGATPTARGYLQSVIGDDIASGSFSELSAMVQTHVRRACGLSLILIPRLETTGTLGPATGTWTVTVDGTTHTIDTTLTSGLTIAPTSSSATVTNVSAPGIVFQRIDCAVAATPLASSTVLPMTMQMSSETTTSCQLVGRSP